MFTHTLYKYIYKYIYIYTSVINVLILMYIYNIASHTVFIMCLLLVYSECILGGISKTVDLCFNSR